MTNIDFEAEWLCKIDFVAKNYEKHKAENLFSGLKINFAVEKYDNLWKFEGSEKFVYCWKVLKTSQFCS